MRFIACLLCIVANLTNPALAQYVSSFKNNNLKIGAGYANMGGLHGMHYYNEYNRKLTSYVQIAPVLSFTTASTPEKGPYFTQKTLLTADVNIYFTPIQLLNKLGVLKWRNHNLKLGGGVGMRYLTQSQFTGSNMVGGQPDQFSFQTKKGWRNGFGVIVEYEWTFADKWVLGPRASVQTYEGGEAVDFVGFNTGIKF